VFFDQRADDRLISSYLPVSGAEEIVICIFAALRRLHPVRLIHAIW
jgi:hypothetical protein